MKLGRAPGPDGILAESLKLRGLSSVYWMKALFDVIWRKKEVPADWRRQILIPVHKKGSHTVCDNYHGIALLSIPSKVFSRVILNGLKPWAEDCLSEGQCGFCMGGGCADQLFTLQILMEKAKEYHQSLYI